VGGTAGGSAFSAEWQSVATAAQSVAADHSRHKAERQRPPICQSTRKAFGYVEGENSIVEQRYAAGAFDRLDRLAADLVRLNMDVIVVDGTATANVVKIFGPPLLG
jgi:hypothetical protein